LEAQARALLDEIDRRGGAVAAIEQGWQQLEIHKAAYRVQQEIERGERTVVGVNEFTIEKEKPPRIFKLDSRVQKTRIAAVREVRRSRDSRRAEAARAALVACARSTDNLIPSILDAVEARVTLGEICDSLESVFGKAQSPRG